MKTRLENKLSMAKAVQNALQMHSTMINMIPAYSATKTELESTIEEIDQLVQVQAEQIGGVTGDKQAAEARAIAAAIRIIGPVKSYAVAENDGTLLESVNYSQNKLERMRDTDLVNVLNLIKDNVVALGSSLVAYGITAADITGYENAVSEYAALVAAPRTSMNIRAQATEQLNSTFEKMDKVLQRLDGFADLKKESEPEFYLTYKNARVIVDHPASVNRPVGAGNGTGTTGN